MKKILLSTITLSAMLFAGGLSTEKINELTKSSKVLSDPAITIIDGLDLDSTYLLKLNAKGPKGGSREMTAFYDKKTAALYIGAGFDKNGDAITFPADPKIVEEAVIFSYGNGPKELYVVTDPQCPYCIDFYKKSKDKLKDYTVKVILMPLSFHKEAPKMINYIIAGKDNAEKSKRYSEVMSEKTEYKDFKMNDENLKKSLGKTMPAVKELGVRGTPSFYIKKDGKFTVIQSSELLK